MRKAIYAGTFDPPHRGHLDIITRGAALVDELVVAVAVNRAKQTVFSADARVKLVEACTRDIAAVRVVAFDGLLTDLLRTEQGSFLLRGLRNPSDLDHETPMALMNRELPGEAETVFLLTSARLAHISSSLVREIASFGGDVRPFLPEAIVDSVVKGL